MLPSLVPSAKDSIRRSRAAEIKCKHSNLGHVSVETTIIYTHVVKELLNPATSPLDLLRRGAHAHRGRSD